MLTPPGPISRPMTIRAMPYRIAPRTSVMIPKMTRTAAMIHRMVATPPPQSRAAMMKSIGFSLPLQSLRALPDAADRNRWTLNLFLISAPPRADRRCGGIGGGYPTARINDRGSRGYPVPRRLRENGLSIAMFGLFGMFIVGQALTGWNAYNTEQREHLQPTVGLGSYLTTGHFVEATFENWESEFLQMASYVLLTIWLVQKGSSESKPPGGRSHEGRGSKIGVRSGASARSCTTWRVAAQAVRELVGDRAGALVRTVVRAARPGGCSRLQRGASGSWASSRQHYGVRDHIYLLVPVVPELAERVRGRRQYRRPDDLSPTAGFSRIEACRCPSRSHRRMRNSGPLVEPT